MAKKETIAWEHSEPGTGPIPRYQPPEDDDRAVKSGSRRDSPPVAYQESSDQLYIDNYLAGR